MFDLSYLRDIKNSIAEAFDTDIMEAIITGD